MPSLNEYTRACRTNKYVGASMKKNYEKIIGFEIRKQLKNQHIEGKAFLRFKWYEPNKKRDLDNICFAKKFILDALVTNGIIDTDGWNGVADFSDKFEVDKYNPRIEVEIGAVNEKIV